MQHSQSAGRSLLWCYPNPSARIKVTRGQLLCNAQWATTSAKLASPKDATFLATYGEKDPHLVGATQISASSLLVARPRAMASALRAFFAKAAA